MKIFKILGIYIAIIGSLLAISSCSKGVNTNTKEELWVRGNCEMCKERIEGSVKGIEGVGSAVWDIETSMLSVEFDSNKVKLVQIHDACANVGHETKMVASAEDIHDRLPECCQKGNSMQEKTACCGNSCCAKELCKADEGNEKCGSNCCKTESCQKSKNSCCKKPEIKS
ncbi:MAG: heavy-metal-associated domain-containing protein [Cytophagales bacterium]